MVTYSLTKANEENINEARKIVTAFLDSQTDRLFAILRLLYPSDDSEIVFRINELKQETFRKYRDKNNLEILNKKQAVIDLDSEINQLAVSFRHGLNDKFEGFKLDLMMRGMSLICVSYFMEKTESPIKDCKYNDLVLQRFEKFFRTVESTQLLYEYYSDDEFLRASRRNYILNNFKLKNFDEFIKEITYDDENISRRIGEREYDYLGVKRFLDAIHCVKYGVREADIHFYIKAFQEGEESIMNRYKFEKDKYEKVIKSRYDHISEHAIIPTLDRKTDFPKNIYETDPIDPVYDEYDEEEDDIEDYEPKNIRDFIKETDKVKVKKRKFRILNKTKKEKRGMGTLAEAISNFSDTFSTMVGSLNTLESEEDVVSNKIRDQYKVGEIFDPNRVKTPSEKMIRNFQNNTMLTRGFSVDGSEVFFMIKNNSSKPVLLFTSSGEILPLKPPMLDYAMDKTYEFKENIEIFIYTADKTFDTSRFSIFDIKNKGRILSYNSYEIPEPDLEPVFVSEISMLLFANPEHLRKMMDHYDNDYMMMFTDINKSLYGINIPGFNNFVINISENDRDIYAIKGKNNVVKIPRAPQKIRRKFQKEKGIENISHDEIIVLSGTALSVDRLNHDPLKDGRISFPFTKESVKVIRIPFDMRFDEGVPMVDRDTSTMFFLSKKDAEVFTEKYDYLVDFYKEKAYSELVSAHEAELDDLADYYDKSQAAILKRVLAMISGGVMSIVLDRIINIVTNKEPKPTFSPALSNSTIAINRLGKFRINTKKKIPKPDDSVEEFAKILRTNFGHGKIIRKPKEIVEKCVEKVKEVKKAIDYGKMIREGYREAMIEKELFGSVSLFEGARSITDNYRLAMAIRNGIDNTRKVSMGTKILNCIKSAFKVFSFAKLII